MEGNVTAYQVRMYYNNEMESVNTATTKITFNVATQPDEEFNDTVVVSVAAINRFGVGPAVENSTKINSNDNKACIILSNSKTPWV